MSMVGEYIITAFLCSMGYIAAVTPRGIPRADLIVHDLANGRSRPVQVKTFMRRENRCPLIGIRAAFDYILRSFRLLLWHEEVVANVPSFNSTTNRTLILFTVDIFSSGATELGEPR